MAVIFFYYLYMKYKKIIQYMTKIWYDDYKNRSRKLYEKENM